MAIIVNMACGLANRMFQYSFYRKLQKQGYDAKVDFFTTANLAHENVDWNNIFPNADFEQASLKELSGLGIGNGIVSKVIRKYLPCLTSVKEMPEAFYVYTPKRKNEKVYLLGVFQNIVVTEGIEDELRQAFRFPVFIDELNISRQQKFASEESVAIHVRKGNDYQTQKWYQNTCHIAYYKEAVALMKQMFATPKFYVFTDNSEWVSNNFGWFDYELVEGNPVAGWGSHFDMQLMSQCKHNIISNSTYSWWSGFLNANPDKIVIIPKIWFNPDAANEKGVGFTSENLLCEKWVAI